MKRIERKNAKLCLQLLQYLAGIFTTGKKKQQKKKHICLFRILLCITMLFSFAQTKYSICFMLLFYKNIDRSSFRSSMRCVAFFPKSLI